MLTSVVDKIKQRLISSTKWVRLISGNHKVVVILCNEDINWCTFILFTTKSDVTVMLGIIYLCENLLCKWDFLASRELKWREREIYLNKCFGTYHRAGSTVTGPSLSPQKFIVKVRRLYLSCHIISPDHPLNSALL